MNIKQAELIFKEKSIKHLPDNPPKFELMKKVKRFRCCGYYDHRNHIIKLQPTYIKLNKKEVVENTILHEIAHAMTPMHGHNYHWKRTFISIGGNGKRFSSGVHK